MAFLSDQDQQVLRDKFAAEMDRDVRLLFFTRRPSRLILPGQPPPEQDFQYLRQAEQLMEEVAALSPKLKLEVIDFQADAARARAYAVDKVPALMLEADGTALRFFGLPAGYEFSTFIQDVLDLSTNHIELSDEAQRFLQGLEQDVHLQVFVTPT